MSTDLRDRTTNPAPDEGSDPQEKPKGSLSFAQVVGGALAAMTAAALGSRLSVAGTVVGAAFASVIAAVAGAVYTSSLHRTSQTVRTVIVKTRTRPGAPGDAGPVAVETGPPVPTWDAAQASTPEPSGTQAPSGRRRIGWKPVLVAALLMFVLAAVALTGVELVTGHALSGGTGTTVGQVAERQTEPSSAPTKAAKASPTPSVSPSASTPTASPSSAPSGEPSAAPSTSPTAAPAPSSSPTPSGGPSPAASSPAAASTP